MKLFRTLLMTSTAACGKVREDDANKLHDNEWGVGDVKVILVVVVVVVVAVAAAAVVVAAVVVVV